MKLNYDKLMQKELEGFNSAKEKPKVLLHACCAPCSSASLERLIKDADVTVYFYNPNMDGIEEYERREKEEKRLCEKMGVKEISEKYDSQEFYSCVKGLEKEPEGGKRCEKCFYLRLKRTANKAKEMSFEYFTTSLTLSPLKNSAVINETGKAVEEETGVKFLPCDFKKRGGYQRSLELSQEYSLYRQNYCGCVFSKKTEKSE